MVVESAVWPMSTSLVSEHVMYREIHRAQAEKHCTHFSVFVINCPHERVAWASVLSATACSLRLDTPALIVLSSPVIDLRFVSIACRISHSHPCPHPHLAADSFCISAL